MECKPISEHSIRSDYWHIYPLFFFYFSSVSNELNSKKVLYFFCDFGYIINRDTILTYLKLSIAAL